MEPREKRTFWYVSAESWQPQQVVGELCGASMVGYWWVPEKGASVCEGYNLFASEMDAWNALRAILRKQVFEAQETVMRLQDRLAAVADGHMQAARAHRAKLLTQDPHALSETHTDE